LLIIGLIIANQRENCSSMCYLCYTNQGFICDGTWWYGVPGNENCESIVCMSVLYQYDKLIMAYRHLFERNIKNA